MFHSYYVFPSFTPEVFVFQFWVKFFLYSRWFARSFVIFVDKRCYVNYLYYHMASSCSQFKSTGKISQQHQQKHIWSTHSLWQSILLVWWVFLCKFKCVRHKKKKQSFSKMKPSLQCVWDMPNTVLSRDYYYRF